MPGLLACNDSFLTLFSFCWCMDVDVFLERKNTMMKVHLDGQATVATLLAKISINPVEVVVSRNGEIVTEDAPVQDKDQIKVFSVISGG